ERRQGMQHEVTQILAESDSLESALQRLLKRLGEILAWNVGVLWRAEGGALRPADAWSAPAPGCREFVVSCRDRICVPGTGACRRAGKERASRWVADVQQSPEFDRPEAAKKAGLHSSFALPVVDNGAVFGVLEFFSEETQEPDEPLVRTLNAVASQISQFIERKRAEEDLRFQKSLLESQSEAAIDGILVVSGAGVMTSFNRRFAQMWDIPDEILQSRTDERAIQFVLDKLQNPKEFLARVRYLYEHP